MMWNPFDHYSMRARLQPALITLLPLAFGVFAWVEPGKGWMSTLWTVLGTSGATYGLAIMARNRGKALEPQLWDSWGGAPTTQLLRHSGPANHVLRDRWHSSVAKLLQKALPSQADEQANPGGADAVYEAVTRLLIDKRRDKSKFPLVYKELVNYGFCRNLYGQRGFGIFASIAGILSALAAGWHFVTAGKPIVLPWVCAGLSALVLMGWLFVISTEWVRVPAFAYANRLLESSEALPKSRGPSSSSNKA